MAIRTNNVKQTKIQNWFIRVCEILNFIFCICSLFGIMNSLHSDNMNKNLELCEQSSKPVG